MIIINGEMSAQLMAHRHITTLEICKPAPHTFQEKGVRIGMRSEPFQRRFGIPLHVDRGTEKPPMPSLVGDPMYIGRTRRGAGRINPAAPQAQTGDCTSSTNMVMRPSEVWIIYDGLVIHPHTGIVQPLGPNVLVQVTGSRRKNGRQILAKLFIEPDGGVRRPQFPDAQLAKHGARLEIVADPDALAP